MRAFLAAQFLAVLAVLVAVPARAADHPKVALTYTGTKDCPDVATFRGLVAARLGYDPFVDTAEPLALRVEFRTRGGATTGSLKLTSDGTARGDRSMTAAPGDCYELAASLALAAAVAVDPESAMAERPSAAPAATNPPPEPPPVQPKASPPPPPPPSPPRVEHYERPLNVFLGGGGLVSFGMQPGPAAGLGLGVGLRGAAWSIAVEAAAFLPSRREESYGDVSAHALYGALVPCAHLGGRRVDVGVCAALAAGALFSEASGVTRPEPKTDLYATLGPRLGLTVMASEVVGFRLTAEAPVALNRAHLLIDDGGTSREAWVQHRVGFIGGAGVVLALR